MGWNIPVEPVLVKPIFSSNSASVLREQGIEPLVEDDRSDSGVFLGKRCSGGCCFLQDDNLCALHRELGYEMKPLQCRQFPFLPVRTPSGVYVGVSFFCTAVQREHGRPIVEHEETIVELLGNLEQKLGATEVPSDLSIPVHAGWEVDWEGYLKLEADILESLSVKPLYETLVEAVARVCSPNAKEVMEACALGSSRPVIVDLAKLFAATLIGIVEVAKPSDRPKFSQDILRGEVVRFFRLDEEVDCGSVWSGVAELSPLQWLEKERKRYFEHLVFRKFLIQGPTIQSRLCNLLVLAIVLDFYLILSMKRASRLEPVMEDWWYALDVVEGELVAHASGLEPIIELMGSAFMEALT